MKEIMKESTQKTVRLHRTMVAAAVLIAAGALLTTGLVAQDLHPSRRPSPMGLARTSVGNAYIHVVYSRPYERGRDNIFGTEESGALVPYGKLWRLGANESTELAVNKDLMVAGQKLPAGIYSMFATPGEKEWKIHINSKLGLSGPGMGRNPETGEFENLYDEANNVVDVTVPVGKVADDGDDDDNDKVEQFTISFEDPEEGEGTHMVFRWITTEVRVPITAGM